MENEIEQLRQDLKKVAITTSHLGGQLQAVMNALHGMFYEISLDARQRAAAEHFLEQGVAHNLAVSENPHFVNGYDSAVSYLRAALAATPTGYKVPTGSD